MNHHTPAARFSEYREPGRNLLSARKLGAALDMNFKEIGELVGFEFNETTASGARDAQSHLAPLASILDSAREMTRDPARIAAWFKQQPLPGWGGKTAYDLVREQKAQSVLAYLEAVRAGGYA